PLPICPPLNTPTATATPTAQPTPGPTGNLKITPRTLNFGMVGANEGMGKIRVLTLKNTGTSNINGTDSFPPGTAYTVVNGGSFNLAPKARATITINFAPTSIGQMNTNLNIVDSQVGASAFITVPVSGFGAPGKLGISPKTLN